MYAKLLRQLRNKIKYRPTIWVKPYFEDCL